MSLSNSSQLLIRNIDNLSASRPLFVNPPADCFFDDYCRIFPNASPSSVHFFYDDYLTLSAQYGDRLNSHFTEHYQAIQLHDLAIIYFPKTKAELAYTLAMIANSLADNARIIFVGDNKCGIKSVDKLASNYVEHITKIDNARHCLLYSGQHNNEVNTFNIDEWYTHYTVEINAVSLTIAALPGVFSHNRLDAGTALLLSTLPTQLSGKILDFGCGAGVIGAFIAKRYPDTQLSLLDVNSLAIASAQKTLASNQLTGSVIPSNGLQQVTEKYNHIISNPPFHQGLKTNYHTTETFIGNVSNYLKSGGSLLIVANSFLHYSPLLSRYIGKVQPLKVQNGFTVYCSQQHNTR